MPTLTPWGVIARSGATVDGRKLPAEAIKKMAANYDPAKYTAVNRQNRGTGKQV